MRAWEIAGVIFVCAVLIIFAIAFIEGIEVGA